MPRSQATLFPTQIQSPAVAYNPVMFPLFLTDYLGLSLEDILQHMPKTGDGAPLGDTFGALVKEHPDLVPVMAKTWPLDSLASRCHLAQRAGGPSA